MRVAILGCGPSALVAAHAAVNHGNVGADIRIFSIKRKSPIYGAQYLHQPIPYVFACDAEPRVIRYVMQGEPEAYLKKVYGAAWDGTISDDLRDQAHLAWDIRAAYDELWEIYGPFVEDVPLPTNPEYRDLAVSTLLREFDMVINTIPRPTLCLRPDQHQFVSTDIWSMGDTPERKIPMSTARDEMILYNGDSTPSWYRISRMYGFSTVEWSGHGPQPPFNGVAKVRKPLSHNCDCFPDVVHLGRFGRWQNGRLVHHVYADTIEQIMIREMAA